jgi:hypothetical protein
MLRDRTAYLHNTSAPLQTALRGSSSAVHYADVPLMRHSHSRSVDVVHCIVLLIACSHHRFAVMLIPDMPCMQLATLLYTLPGKLTGTGGATTRVCALVAHAAVLSMLLPLLVHYALD